MKAVCDYTPEEYSEMRKKYDTLKEKIKMFSRDVLLLNLQQNYGYAKYKFSGDISNVLIEALGREPTEDEIIMIVDNGFSHFGATCGINGRHFSGTVYID